MKQNNDRLEELERQQNLNLRYQRRDTIEITGIPSSIKQEELEEEVMKIFDAGHVSVHGRKLDTHQIQACHRIGKKGITICKFINRKYAQESLYCEKNLKDVEIYGKNSRIYINNSFCDEFKYLTFLIRKAKGKEIVKWRIKRGINLIQVRGRRVC